MKNVLNYVFGKICIFILKVGIIGAGKAPEALNVGINKPGKWGQIDIELPRLFNYRKGWLKAAALSFFIKAEEVKQSYYADLPEVSQEIVVNKIAKMMTTRRGQLVNRIFKNEYGVSLLEVAQMTTFIKLEKEYLGLLGGYAVFSENRLQMFSGEVYFSITEKNIIGIENVNIHSHLVHEMVHIAQKNDVLFHVNDVEDYIRRGDGVKNALSMRFHIIEREAMKFQFLVWLFRL